MMTQHATGTEPTADEIDAAILAALAETGDELVCWTSIQHRVPGSWWAKTEAYTRLWLDYRINAMKIRGSPYCWLPDAFDLEVAAQARAEGRVRELRCI
jgi:hypothetical protein